MQVQDSVSPETAETLRHTLWVVGDSTVSEFNDDYYYPRYGWGTMLKNYFHDINIENLAVSGTSSRSFTSTDNYRKLLQNMKKGDYLLIGFGHNDEKTEIARYTNPNGDKNSAGSFQYSLYENYILPARNRGVIPVLCTPIVRRNIKDDYSGADGHITQTQIVDSKTFPGGNYTAAIKSLGDKVGITVIDLTTKTKNLYQLFGTQYVKNHHAQTSSKDNSIDNTHTNIYGAAYNAYFIAEELVKSNCDLKKYVMDNPQLPSLNILKINPNYVEKVYKRPTNDSRLWQSEISNSNNDKNIWKGTVFGDVGKNNINKNNFSLSIANSSKNDSSNEDLEFKLRAGIFAIDPVNGDLIPNKGFGKISSNSDGIAMYYKDVPADKNFTLSADVTINEIAINNQVSFGLMARDDIYVDRVDSSKLGDYVVAGPLQLASTKQWNCFARKNGKLVSGGICKKTYHVGDTIHLEIKKTDDGYTCTYGENQAASAGFDFKLTTIDSDYVYVGMFVSRNADVVFKNVKLNIE